MVFSVLKFGLKQSEAVAVGTIRLGWGVARMVIGVVVDVATPNRSHEPAATEPPTRFAQPTEPAEEPTEPAEEPTDPTEEPTETAEVPTETADEPTETTEEATSPADPERERRMALRDQPSESGEESPHHVLNNPVTDDPDPTEWPDPYDQREDPRDPDVDGIVLPGDVPHTPTGSQSTSSPHPSQDPEAERWNGPKAPDSPR